VAIGAGTVLDGATARACIDAGAKFLTSPGVEVAVIAAAVKHRTLVFPGVLTPTDVIVAIESGADLLKLFPCAPWGGAAYLKSLSAPFPDVGFIAAGGVTLQTLGEYFLAGAIAVGVGSELIPRQAVHDRDRRWITELARRFLGAAQQSRVSRQGQHDVSGRR
jgi:2-dehydro-3-deoxyphosphogluconate aldolase/(4S)-4-hydroxy-2-oxoglutarate aldolase